MNQIQFKANELNEEDKKEAEAIARKLFGCYDWQGMKQEIIGNPGMAQYINKSVLPKIKPQGAKWLVAEKQSFENGFIKFDKDGLMVKSTYYHKRI